MKSIKQLGVLTQRILKQNLTNPDTIITVLLMPLFMLLFFVYVFGGNLSMGGAQITTKEYLSYSLPGFLLVTMAMGSAYTALRINNDKNKGFLQRLHSLPIKRWIILGSHVVASVVFMLLAELVVFLVSLLMGYRGNFSAGDMLLFVGFSALFAFGLTLMAIPFSLKASDYNGAGGFSYILLMLLFVSSAFIPMAGMAKPVRLFAEHQPMTPIVETARKMLAGSFSFGAHDSVLAFIWLGALIVVFSFFSYRRYQWFTRR